MLKAVIAIILVLFGIFSLAAPGAAWYLSRGWQFKDAEPSDAALAVTRVVGGVMILIGVVTVFS